MRRLLIATLPLVAGALAWVPPAMAQAQGPVAGTEKMNMVIVYGEDPCPKPQGDEITVCARKDEGERFRIPATLRESTSPANDAWTNRVSRYEMVGAAGTGSCSATGAGGWTGCANKFVHDAYAEKKAETDVHFGEMIAAERAKREGGTDAAAAAEQARVEAVEKEQAARKAAAASAAPAAKP